MSKVINYFSIKFPLLYILIKRDINFPLYKQSDVYLILVIILAFFISAREKDYHIDLILLHGFSISLDFILWLLYILLLKSLNNIMVDHKDSGFYNKILMTNQNSSQIYIGYAFGGAFKLICIVLLLILSNTIIRYFITYDIIETTLIFISSLLTLFTMLSFSMLLAHYIKINTITSLIIAFLVMMVGVQDIGLVEVLLGTNTTFTVKTALWDFLLGDQDVSKFQDVSTYVVLVMQFTFTVVLIISAKNQFKGVKPSSISQKHVWMIMIMLFSFAILFLYLPKTQQFEASILFCDLRASNDDYAMLIYRDFAEEKFHCIIRSKKAESFHVASKSKDLDTLLSTIDISHDKEKLRPLVSKIRNRVYELYSDSQVIATFTWIMILSNVLFLISYVDIFKGNYTELNSFALFSHMIIFISTQVFGLYLMYIVGIKQFTMKMFFNSLHAWWELLFYFPLILFINFLRKYYSNRFTTKYIIYTNIFILAVFFLILLDNMETSSFMKITLVHDYKDYLIGIVLSGSAILSVSLMLYKFIRSKLSIGGNM